MNPRVRRIATWTATVVVVVAVAAGTTAWWLTTTQSGARWGFERMGALLPGNLDVRGMSGPLRSPFEVRQLTYRTERMEITADRVRVRWNLGQLLRRRLDIDELYAEDVRVLMGSSGDKPEERDSLSTGLPDVDLPVSILVRQGLLNRLQITAPGAAKGLLIDAVRLDASTFRDSLNVNHLSVSSRTLDVELQGSAWPQGAYPLALAGRWTWRRPGMIPIRGEGVLAGTIDTIHVKQSVSGPFTGDIDGTLYRLLRRRLFDGDLTFQGLDPATIEPEWPRGVYTGRAHVRGDLSAFVGDGVVHTRLASFGPTDAAFRVVHQGDAWDITRLAMTFPGNDARLDFRGRVTTPPGRVARFRLDTRWANLDWPLRGEPWVNSPSGHGVLEGTAGDMEVRLAAELGGRDLPPGHWTLHGRGGNGRLAVRTVVADLLDGRVVGSGRVAWEPRFEWQLTFQGRDIDPASVWPAWPGSLAFDGATRGTVHPTGPTMAVSVNRLGGALRGQPIEGRGTWTARGRQYAFDSATVQWGPNRARVSGGFGDAWSLAFAVDAPRLDAALPHTAGSVRALGRVEGPRGGVRVAGTAEADSVLHRDVRVGSFRARTTVAPGASGALAVDVTAADVNVGRQALRHVVLTGRGTSERHEVRASVAGRGDSMVAVFDGGLERGGRWRGLVRTLDLIKTTTGNWSLEAPAALAASWNDADLDDFVWRSGAARLALDADWRRDGPWSVDARLDSVSLGSVEPWMPPDLRLEGPLRGIVQARADAAGRLFTHVDVVPGPGSLRYLSPAGEWIPTPFENARLRADARGDGLTGDVTADLPGTGSLRGSLGLPGLQVGARPASAQQVDGRLALHLTDLGLIQGLTPDLDATAGKLDAELVVGGSLASPSLQGTARLRDGSADVPRLGIHVQEATLDATSSSGGGLAVEGAFRSGPGWLRFDGTADLADRARLSAQLRASGERVQAMDTREVSMLLSPDVHLTLADGRLGVRGEVTMPEGDLIIHWDADDLVQRPSTDVVLTGGDTTRRLMPVEFDTHVRLVVGDQVRLRGFGLDARPSGSVLVIDEPGLPMTGTGQLRVANGTYRVYGQELAIEHGWLLFGGGPIVNPGLDVRAQRTAADGVIAGFDVKGTVERPEIKVFSRPPLGESQALAYILLGRPLEAANLPEGQLVSTLATTLGLNGTNFVAHGVASDLGIDEARIDAPDGVENSSLILGSQLSRRLYLGYGVGLFDPTTVVRLRYLLTRSWTIEAETARQNRVDLLYTIER